MGYQERKSYEILANIHNGSPGQQESVYRYSKNDKKVSLETP